ncbi:hypothetical protein F5Y15DRAFT_156271 [Xylariaceae sp. FL0016]|nr:hypothetical protein F5Y15DRAFT_156271 [Xylariaceae sp. FL0016]
MPGPKVSLAFLKRLWPRRRSDNAVASIAASEVALDTACSSEKHEKDPAAAAAPELEECPICHDLVGVANPEGIVEEWTSLHCGHRFGTHCIQTWLEESIVRDPNTSLSCPICRATAKHPCGHLVAPQSFAGFRSEWANMHNSYIAYAVGHGNADYVPGPWYPPPGSRRRPRRRLVRRIGHPDRPVIPPRRIIQPIGDCKTCKDNAAFDARVAETARRRNTAESALSSNGSRTSRSGIKSLIPGLGRSNAREIRTTVVSMAYDYSPNNFGSQSRDCWGARLTGVRPPTPTPGHGRRLSV